MNIALTGATGFLGSTLLPRLVEAGHSVRALVRRPLTLPGAEQVMGDVTEAQSCAALVAGCDALMHLAGMVSRDPSDGPAMYRLHVEGTRTLLGAAAEAKLRRVVLASTSGTIAVFKTARVGTEHDDYPLTTVARWPYYLSKIYQEKAAFELCRKHGLALVCLNPSLILGPGDERCSSVGDVWRFLHRDIPAMPGGGLSFVDVRDAADAFLAALTRGRPFERYLLGAANMPFTEFFGRLARLTGVPAPRLRLPGPLKIWGTEALVRLADWRGVEPAIDRASVEMGECFFYLDGRKAEEELGFTPRDPQETLRDTVNDLRLRGKRRAGTGSPLVGRDTPSLGSHGGAGSAGASPPTVPVPHV